MKRWETASCDEAAAARLAREVGLPPPVARSLVCRGQASAADVEAFLNPALSSLSDPFLLPDARPAVERIRAALRRGERIVVFGDYDVDGLTASALLVRVIRGLGGTIEPFLPSRFTDGYGLSSGALARCLSTLQPGLLITVDCGTTSAAEVEEARVAGVDVIVTDHHELGGPLPAAVAVVNPRRLDDERFAALAGVGVVFKLCHALVKAMRADGEEARVDLRDWLDLVAVGTVADVAPLVHENRVLVRHGIDRLNRSPLLGLAALREVARIGGALDTYHIGYMIGPRLNAAGRMAEAGEALRLLLTADPREAAEIAAALDRANGERQATEKDLLAQATAQLDGTFREDADFGLVVDGRGWHEGVIGIVASRIVARYRRPAVVVAVDDEGGGRGSCRSIEELDLIQALHGCSDVLESYGGHAMAAGLNLRADRIEEFRRRFGEMCAQALRGKDLRPVVKLDAWVAPAEIDRSFMGAVERMAPFGTGNPAPVWGIRGLRTAGPARTVGGAHLRLTLQGGGARLQAIAFRMTPDAVPDGELDVAAHVQRNTYGGRDEVELNLRDLRAHEPA